MTLAKLLALLGFLVMLGALLHGFTVGDFTGEGATLLSLAWGRVSLIDVYVGFALFCGWIVYRERSAARSALWVASVLVLGNMAACLYVLIVLHGSRGDWPRFWLGQQVAR